MFAGWLVVPSTSAAFSVTATRANGARPIIAAAEHRGAPVAGAHTAASHAYYNFNPTALQLPNGSWALITRTVERQADPATPENPDFLTLSRVQHGERGGAVVVDDINETSVILRPTANATFDDRGVQDPRVIRDPSTGVYWLTFSSIGSGFIGSGIATSTDGLHWEKVGRCDADHNRPYAPGWDGQCGYGRAAAMLYREEGEHYMIWGPGGLNLARSVNRSLANWTTVQKAWLSGLPERGAWVNPGGPPVRLSSGHYLFLYVEAGAPKPPLPPAPAVPCPSSPAHYTSWWGIGWAILNGTDPAQIIQRGSELLFPTTDWEANRTFPDGSQTEWRGCMIGDASGMQPLEEKDTFMVYYGGGDAVSGAAIVKVSGNADRVDGRDTRE